MRFISPLTDVAPRRALLVPCLTVAFAALALVGCDSATGDDEDGSVDTSVLGRWVDTDEAEYLDISTDEIVVHFNEFDPEEDPDAEDCFERIEVEVLDTDGDEWSIREGDIEEERAIRLERDGDDLVITFDVEEGDDLDTERYRRSTRTDFTPLCD